MSARKPLLSVDAATAAILDEVVVGFGETVAIEESCGRTLRTSLVSAIDQPPFVASAMDGYAVRSADLKHSETAATASLRVVGEAAAGHPFDGPLPPMSGVRIFTGGMLPEGADCVLIQEDAVRKGDVLTSSAVVEPGQWVRAAGGDFSTGQTLVEAGTILTARDILLTASAGHANCVVTQAPRVGILATGDELVAPGGSLAPGQIFSSVPAGLAALVTEFGGVPVPLGIAEDTPEALGARLAKADACDVLMTIGGASVGDHDLVHAALRQWGVDLSFWKIAMRPGKPLMYGRRRSASGVQHVIGLPGNPVSGMVCARIFVAPLLAALLGRSAGSLAPQRLPLATPRPANGPRRHYMRGQIHSSDAGRQQVRVLPRQDSSLTSVLAAANALVVTPENAPAADPGTVVDVLPLDF
ncbi:MAG: gephyrin-like molybdotransferase Glp [Pseudomonadota bacterium]